MISFLRAAVLALAAFSLAPAAQAQTFTPAQREEIRTLVREYLVANPEVLEEAQAVLAKRREAAVAAEQKRLASAIMDDPRIYKSGPANAPIQLIEFYDYNCSFCKRSVGWMMSILRNRKDVRVALVDFPILAESSIEASQAALATIRQGKHLEFHQALMGQRGAISTETINAAAKTAGVDIARMRRDMADPAIMKLITDNQLRGAGAGVEGTPTFFINGEAFTFGAESELLAALDAAKKPGARAKGR